MAFKKKESQGVEIQEPIKDEIKKMELTNAEKEAFKKAEQDRIQINALNTEKAHKDIFIKNIQELQEHDKRVRAELINLSNELETKYRALKNVDEEIKSKTYELNRQNENFEKTNREKIRLLDKRQSDIEESDKQYKNLIVETNQLKINLKNDLSKISDERREHASEKEVIGKNMQDIKSEWSKKEADILEREDNLKKEKEAFESEKEALKPELTRISEIKNENLLLWQRIDDEKGQLERQKNIFDSHRQKMAEDAEAGKLSIKKLEESLLLRESKLRKWEQDLTDIQLEVKAREVEIQKAIKRYQLKESIKNSGE